MGKKSAAQLRRMQARAEARGEKYVLPQVEEEQPGNEEQVPESSSDALVGSGAANKKSTASEGGDASKRRAAAKKLQLALASLESNAEMKAKERRSAKRKAEAIAAEEAGCDAPTLLEWYETNNAADDSAENAKKKAKQSHSPCILFIGQLSYDTTKEALFKHIQDNLGKDVVTAETLRVRLLTDDKKKNRSRGMAFVETTDPEISFQCLKLHHTNLNGRRINVERSAGGKKGSEARRGKIDQYRKEQVEYMSEAVDRVLADHRSKGDLEEGELDDGVILLCKRHSAATVETALSEYVEERGKEMDNPSAYLTSIIGRVAIEGPGGGDSKEKRRKDMFGGRKKHGGKSGDYSAPKGRGGSTSSTSRGGGGGSGRAREGADTPLRKASEFAKAGIDMSVSDGDNSGNDMLKIFPSMGRGRGRGRGAYM